MIVEALEKAKSHDEFQQKNSTTLGPLHGVPFTLKDTFDVESYDTSIGITTRINQPAQTSSVFILNVNSSWRYSHCKNQRPTNFAFIRM